LASGQEVDLLQKAATGIDGFDEITNGGLPKGRPSLVCGSAGCGKTLFALEFLVRGALQFNEPGVFVAFEETQKDLVTNVASLGFRLDELEAQNLLRVDHVHVDRSEIEEVGEYDLEGLFVRLGYLIDQIGATRVVIDTLETIFASFDNTAILRSELRRLFTWLKDKGVTAIITGERGEGQLTRQGLEEYVSDCVILLDHRIINQVSTRRLRIVKYRGSTHGTNEYPFLIDKDGFSVLPVTALGLKHSAQQDRVSSGVSGIDAMLGGKGYYRGSSVLISGTSGTGKSSLAACFAKSTCERGERCLYFAFEESEPQVVRNMRSIGLDLQPYIDQGLLRILATRPTLYGLEMHLATMQRTIKREQPSAVIIDPISNLDPIGSQFDISAMLTRLVDFLKANGTTGLFVNLNSADGNLEKTESGLSSTMDTWILVKFIEASGERNRGLYVLKSRGMAHSNQVQEFVITDHGLSLRDAYLGTDGVLTGSARLVQEAKEKADRNRLEWETQRKFSAFDRKRKVLQAQLLAIQAEIEDDELTMEAERRNEQERLLGLQAMRMDLAQSRSARTSREDSGVDN